ncbi:galactosyltransferase-related protein [Stigmatella aurantiaca]|nr:galactosyltransferase-related protein [Stigmatella aurantiaca]
MTWSPRMLARPPLSVIIPWRDRPELGVTLQRNRRVFVANAYEVLVVSCGGAPKPFRRLLRARRFPGLRGVELPGVAFNKSLALNIGASLARSDRLFFLDADVVLRGDFLGESLKKLGTKHFLTVERVFESERPASERSTYLCELSYAMSFVDSKGRTAFVDTHHLNLREGSRGGPGMVLLRRKHFEAVKGMNSDLLGWGWEDLDLLVRLQLALGLKQRRHGRIVHLTHGDELRALEGESRGASEHRNLVRCLENYQRGHYGGTHEEDVQTWQGRLTVFEPSARRRRKQRLAARP